MPLSRVDMTCHDSADQVVGIHARKRTWLTQLSGDATSRVDMTCHDTAALGQGCGRDMSRPYRWQMCTNQLGTGRSFVLSLRVN